MGSNQNYHERIETHLTGVALALSFFERTGTVEEIVATLDEARRDGKRVWVIGNGGSAATTAHFANDLTKMAKIPAVALTDQVPTLLAYGNDNGWENMFADPLRVMASEGDVLVAITCSGRSGNIIKAVIVAREKDCKVVVLTGNKDQNFFVDHPLVMFVETDDITVQEDCHLVICHAIACALAEA